MTQISHPLPQGLDTTLRWPVRAGRLELTAAASGAGLILIRLTQESQWLPIAIVAAFGAAYGFARPSLRAAIAFVVGALALVGAAFALAGGFTASEIPAFALAPAGIALLAACVIALRSKPRVHGLRRAGRWAGTAVAGFVLLYLFVVAIGAALWITTKPRIAVRPWAVPHRNVELTAPDGVRLAAWYVPSRNGAAVVLVHGGGGSRDGLKLHADMLVRHGYGVLLYDERGRGASGGRSNGLGWDWPQDVETAVTYVEQQGVHHVGVLGLSTGAEVALTAAAEDPRISAVVADGTEARTLDDFEHLKGFDQWTGVPYWGMTTLAVRVIRGTKPSPPLAQVMRQVADKPVLLVQSNDPAEQALAPVWARIDGRPGVLWHVDAAHTKGLATHPAAYERHVLGLFRKALL
jgi:pimeloyl-ACP methyl ester carboxylesterase